MTHLEQHIRGKSRSGAEQFLKSFYDDAYAYGAYHPTNSSYVWEVTMKRVGSFKRGLEVGCGSGAGVRECRNRGKNVYGIDVADARRLWKDHAVERYCLIADGAALPFPDNSFDMVLCTDVLEHIPEWKVMFVLREMYRVGSDRFFIGAHLGQEKVPVGGEIYTHITIKTPKWWRKRIEKARFHIANDAVSKKSNHYSVYAVKDKTPYLSGEKRLIDTPELQFFGGAV